MSHEKYLEHETLSASPQRLQLLLVEAALRQGHRARKCWANHDNEGARNAIERMQAVALQLLNGLSPDRCQPLVQQVAAVYTFLTGELAKARLRRDVAALDGAMRVLETERETWWQVCQQMAASSQVDGAGAPHFGQPPESTSLSSFCMDA